MVIGRGQGALVALMLTSPLALERACRARVVTPEEITAFRDTLPLVQGVVAVDPEVGRGFVDLELPLLAVPELLEVQPARIPKWLIPERLSRQIVVKFGDKIGAWGGMKDFSFNHPREALKKREVLRFDDEPGICTHCGSTGALEFCAECRKVVHLSCCRLKTATDPVVCPSCKDEKEGTDEALQPVPHATAIDDKDIERDEHDDVVPLPKRDTPPTIEE